jgi:hypothetical protein
MKLLSLIRKDIDSNWASFNVLRAKVYPIGDAYPKLFALCASSTGQPIGHVADQPTGLFC